MIPYPLRVGICIALHELGLIPARLAAWYINRLADKLERQERRVIFSAANLAAWPRRVEETTPAAAVEAFFARDQPHDVEEEQARLELLRFEAECRLQDAERARDKARFDEHLRRNIASLRAGY